MRDEEYTTEHAPGAGHRGSSTLGVLLAFVGGALAGAATALLFAPGPGEETRRRLKRLAHRGAEQLRPAPSPLEPLARAASGGPGDTSPPEDAPSTQH